MERNDSDSPTSKNSETNKLDDEIIQIVLPWTGRRPSIIGRSDNYWRQNTRETKAQAVTRRASGMVNEELQSDGFVLDGVDANRWFTSFDLPFETSARIQDETAELLVKTLAPTAEWAGLVRESGSSVPSGQLGMLVMRTNIYLRLKGISKLRMSVVAALVANLITHSPSVAVGATVVAALWDNVRRLTEDELEILHAMQRISDGQVYTQWLSTEAIIRALPKGKKKSHYQSLLASMKSRGILEEGSGMWRAVR